MFWLAFWSFYWWSMVICFSTKSKTFKLLLFFFRLPEMPSNVRWVLFVSLLHLSQYYLWLTEHYCGDCDFKSQNKTLEAVFWRKCCREGEQQRSGRLLSQRHFLHSRFLLRSSCLVAKLSQQIFGFHCYLIRSHFLYSWTNTASDFVLFFVKILFPMLMWLIHRHATP